MERLISQAGHRVRAVASTDEALLALAAADYDVAVVDIEMPGKSGIEAIETFRRLVPELKVLVVSGHDDPRRVLAALEAGAQGYLLKDEIGDGLARAVSDVRAGLTPLSARIGSILLRRLRNKANPRALCRIVKDETP